MAAALAVAALCAAAPLAHAADVGVRGSVRPGRLTVGVPPARALALRSATPRWRTVTFALPFDVRDSRGSGAGWAITLTSAVLRLDGRSTRARGAVTGARASCAGCTLPRNRIAYPVGLSGRAPIRVFAARRRSGMGAMRVWIDATIAIPPGVRHGTLGLVFSHTTGP